jgi:hypothetical protein
VPAGFAELRVGHTLRSHRRASRLDLDPRADTSREHCHYPLEETMFVRAQQNWFRRVALAAAFLAIAALTLGATPRPAAAQYYGYPYYFPYPYYYPYYAYYPYWGYPFGVSFGFFGFGGRGFGFHRGFGGFGFHRGFGGFRGGFGHAGFGGGFHGGFGGGFHGGGGHR